MAPSDIGLILIIILIGVILWRGPKTLPIIGRAFGQGVREARKEIDGIKTDAAERDAAAAKDGTKPSA
jgi:Sec-independent protein translocase protein TatA